MSKQIVDKNGITETMVKDAVGITDGSLDKELSEREQENQILDNFADYKAKKADVKIENEVADTRTAEDEEDKIPNALTPAHGIALEYVQPMYADLDEIERQIKSHKDDKDFVKPAYPQHKLEVIKQYEDQVRKHFYATGYYKPKWDALQFSLGVPKLDEQNNVIKNDAGWPVIEWLNVEGSDDVLGFDTKKVGNKLLVGQGMYSYYKKIIFKVLRRYGDIVADAKKFDRISSAERTSKSNPDVKFLGVNIRIGNSKTISFRLFKKRQYSLSI